AWHLCPASRSLHHRLSHQPKLSASDQSPKPRAADRRVWNLQYRTGFGDHHRRHRAVGRFDVVIAVLACMAIAMALTLGHGLLITRLNMQPFIVTLCGLLFYRGLARFVTN